LSDYARKITVARAQPLDFTIVLTLPIELRQLSLCEGQSGSINPEMGTNSQPHNLYSSTLTTCLLGMGLISNFRVNKNQL
jgi:hypothetical protein